MTSNRTLPLRVAPLPGEALNSWLETVAATLRTPMGELLAAMGLFAENVPSANRQKRLPWLVLLLPHEAEAERGWHRRGETCTR
ncbi:hypothetical protein [Streptomyces europaeiscabiei]|uniref:hypothetical protein n=1 Tax=Streptomyces europaeiscabiei TaxID=146819 RepID=UPI002E19B5E9